MTTINVALPDEMQAWVEGEANSRGFSTLSDYIRDVLLESKARQDVARRHLDSLLQAGLDSGPSREADDKWWQDLKSEVAGEQVRQR